MRGWSRGPRRPRGWSRGPRRPRGWSRGWDWSLKSEDVYFQLRCNGCVAEDDVGEPRVVLNERERGRIQIGFVPEAVAVAQALELIF